MPEAPSFDRRQGLEASPADRRDACAVAGIFESNLIVTIEGERRVDRIHPGDILLVLGNAGYSPVQRVEEVTIDLALRPEARPILMRAGAIGPRAPLRDTILAPDSLVGIDDRLVPVAALMNGRTIAPAPMTGVVRYLRIEMCVNEMVLVDGIRLATLASGDGPCRPLVEAPDELAGLRARIAARIAGPEAPDGPAPPGVSGPRAGPGP